MVDFPTMSVNNTTTLSDCNDTMTHFQYQRPSSFDIFTGILMIFIIIPSLAGNILILYAFVTNPKLRVMTNYFIINLALSDILTTSLVIPFDANMKLNGLSSWTHGAVMCKIWTTLYTISVPTSILTLCVVSIDRYQAISNPLGYRAGVTLNKTKALCLIAGIWTLSLFMAFLPLIAGPPLNVTLSRDLPPDCRDVYFCYFDISPSYSAVVTIIAFIFPSIIMAMLYIRMYVIITCERYICYESESMQRNTGSDRREMNEFGRHTTENSHKESRNDRIGREADKNKGVCNKIDSEQNTAKNYDSKENQQNPIERTEVNASKYNRKGMIEGIEKKWDRLSQNKQEANNCSNATTMKKTGNVSGLRDKNKNQKRNKNLHHRDKNTASQTSQHSNNNQKSRNPSQTSASNSSFQARSHHAIYQTKIARHFSVIVLVQLICWYPFSVQSVVFNLCDSCDHISSSAQYFLLTIGYMSCAINPCLYAYQQRSFRQVFQRMFSRKT